MNRAAQLEAALAAVRLAARAVAAVGDPASFGSSGTVTKGAAGPATVADLASQAAIVASLRASLGTGIRVMAEESADEVAAHGGERLLAVVARSLAPLGIAAGAPEVRDLLGHGGDAGGTGEFWCIDPLDGTKGYLRGGQFAIAVALVAQGRPVVGVLGLPRLAAAGTAAGPGVLVAAVRGEGARQSPLGDWMPAAVDASAWAQGDRIRLAGSVESGHSDTAAIARSLASLGPVESVPVDSQAKYALVARGDADAYVRSSPDPSYAEWAWDHAAGALVAEEAGCRVTDLAGRGLDFGQGRRLSSNRGVACAVPALLGAITAARAPRA